MKVIPKYSAFNDKQIINAIKEMSEEQADILFLTGEFNLGDTKLELYKNCLVRLDWITYDKENHNGEERYGLLYKGRNTENLIFKQVGSDLYESRMTDTHTMNLLTENWVLQPCIYTHWRCHDLENLKGFVENEYRKWKLFCNLPRNTDF